MVLCVKYKKFLLLFPHFVFIALKSHGNPDVRGDWVELKIKRDLP